MLRLRLIFLNIFFILVGVKAFGGTPTWRMQELARASNVLLVEMDKILAHKNSQCRLDAASLSQASQNLKALVDQRAKELVDKQEQILNLMKTCKQDCSCETYEYALEKITSSEKYSTTIKYSAEERQSCAKKIVNFCQSKLFKAIK